MKNLQLVFKQNQISRLWLVSSLILSSTGWGLLTEALSQTAVAQTSATPTLKSQTANTPLPGMRSVTSVDQLEAPVPPVIPQPQRSGSSLSQVTSVTQLSDVKPTDWAYQAVQSLVERYGCIVGYPNSTFQGNRSATRFELAAALNACLDVISDRFATKEDLQTVRRLQVEFAKELAALKGRVANLEGRTALLEARQFSTTTKLTGVALMTFQSGQSSGRFTAFDAESLGFANVERSNLNPSILARVQLKLDTSFNGSDNLNLILQAGNAGQDAISSLGVGTGGLINAGAVDYFGAPSQFQLWRLVYTFKPTENVSLSFGPRMFPSDFVDANSYANNSFQDFSSGFFINNRLTVLFPVDGPGGAGAAFSWNFGGGPVTLRGVYVAATAEQAAKTPFGGGFWGDPYQGTVEVEYASKFGKQGRNNFAVRLQYTNATTFDINQNAAGLNAEATFGRFGVFGRYGYSSARYYGSGGNTLLPFASVANESGRFNAHTWMAGVGVRDLLREGSLLAGAVGQPFLNNLPQNLSADAPNTARQTNYELFFRFPVNDNISITPALLVITDANNNAANSTIFQGLVRTTFTF